MNDEWIAELLWRVMRFVLLGTLVFIIGLVAMVVIAVVYHLFVPGCPMVVCW